MSADNINEALKYLKRRSAELKELLGEFGVSLDEKEDSVYFNTDKKSLKDLKVAAIADAFTRGNFESECNFFSLTCSDWKNEIDSFNPDLLFIESAWNGKNNSWYKKIANGSKELYELSEYCRSKRIPIVFWNKEDPVFTDVFMSAASCADYVFTTDIDCVAKYKKSLNSDNVYLLHFSAQPRVHNPLEMHVRKDKFCFAGAYYHKYKERCRVFDDFADVFESTKGLEIFDRNFKNPRPEHAFPARYNKMILGSLSPDEIHIAYKGYNYGVNMNSVNASQSMFARRVFELLASNTITVGNYSRGQRNFFGDLTISTDNSNELKRHLDKYCCDEESTRKFRLAGLRTVLSYHLCEDRLGYIAGIVFGRDMKKKLPGITLYSYCETGEEVSNAIFSFARQTYKNARLYIITDVDFTESDERVKSIGTDEASSAEFPVNGFIAAMNPRDFYGENYLYDLVLSVRYSSLDGFGKADTYKNENGEVSIASRENTYRECSSFNSNAGIVRPSAVKCDVLSFAKGVKLDGKFLCTDEFNYCENGGQSCEKCGDMFIADKGIELHKLEKLAENIKPGEDDSIYINYGPVELNNAFRKYTNKKVLYFAADGKTGVDSKMSEGEKSEPVIAKELKLSDHGIQNNISIVCACAGDLAVNIKCDVLDSSKRIVTSETSTDMPFLSADIPAGGEYVNISLVITGSGNTEISSVRIGSDINIYEDMPFVSRNDTLVLAPAYPSYDDLYKYMYIHRRLKAYKNYAYPADAAAIGADVKAEFREYDGIDVVSGNADRLVSILENSNIKNIFIHFLDPYIWSIIKPYTDSFNIFIWSHGFDIQPWFRRKYNFETDRELETAKEQSAVREKMWREVFECSKTDNIHFVFVSEYLKNTVGEDYGVEFTDKNSSVIHNCIDTSLYSYEKKPKEQRFKILAVKSFANNNYANDVMTKAIAELSKYDEFKDMTFDIFGDGEKFDITYSALKRYKNVNMNRRYLSPYDIADEHKTHGIFLCTTRMDTQGVSRDEAMSSGLVPVTNAVAAVPEFVDDNCGILAGAEDYKGIADGILRLVRDEKLFEKMSENAAKHVREISSVESEVPKELGLINIKI